ncbi:hypothetical protein N9N28_12435 [Rubripirellula amarantea]|nr:hypothetical protein [Rubripirellula amarantea]
MAKRTASPRIDYPKGGTKLRGGRLDNGRRVGERTTYGQAGEVNLLTMMK